MAPRDFTRYSKIQYFLGNVCISQDNLRKSQKISGKVACLAMCDLAPREISKLGLLILMEFLVSVMLIA